MASEVSGRAPGYQDLGSSARAPYAEPAAPVRTLATGRARGASARGRRKGGRRLPWSEYGLFLLLVAPNLILIAIFAYWPVIYNFILSFQRWNMISPVRYFVGLDNYTRLFESDAFWRIMSQTGVFLAAVVIGSIVLGLLLAVLLNQKIPGRTVVRAVSFMPYIVGGAVIATTWVFIFDPSYGLIRPLLEPLGVLAPDWLSDSTWAMPALIIVYVWRNIGFVAVIYIAGLQTIPPDLYEAAMIDGAGAWSRFRAVTLPMISPITYFLVVITVISTFQAFDVIAIMTSGGPGGSTTVLSWYIYDAAFIRSAAGDAGAAATIMFVLLAAITAVQARLLRRSVHYA